MTTKTVRKKTGALDVIAANMRQMVEAGAAFAHHRLSRGLEIVLQRRGDHQWRLALGRVDVAPSDDEIEICRTAFGVPVDAEVKRSNKTRTNPKTNTTTQWHVADMTWVEA